MNYVLNLQKRDYSSVPVKCFLKDATPLPLPQLFYNSIDNIWYKFNPMEAKENALSLSRKCT